MKGRGGLGNSPILHPFKVSKLGIADRIAVGRRLRFRCVILPCGQSCLCPSTLHGQIEQHGALFLKISFKALDRWFGWRGG